MLKRILYFLFLIASVFTLGACSTNENTSYVYHPSKTELAKIKRRRIFWLIGWI